MLTPENVVILMLTHNRTELAKRCVTSLLPTLSRGTQLIIVDNASSEQTWMTLDRIKTDKITVIRNAQNVGVAAGRNMLLGLAGRTDAQLYTFLDSDVLVRDDHWIDYLLKAIEPENVGLAGPAGSWIDWRFGHPFLQARVGECDVVSGWCQMFKRELVDLAGIVQDEDYGKFYEEDSDFCMQIRDAGWDVINTGPCGLEHVPSNSGAYLAIRANTLARFRQKWEGRGLTRLENAYA